MERLGGQFDYTDFDEELRIIGEEKERIKREFERNRLDVPIPMQFAKKA